MIKKIKKSTKRGMQNNLYKNHCINDSDYFITNTRGTVLRINGLEIWLKFPWRFPPRPWCSLGRFGFEGMQEARNVSRVNARLVFIVWNSFRDRSPGYSSYYCSSARPIRGVKCTVTGASG